MDSDQEEQAVEPGLKDVASIVSDKFFDQMRHTICVFILCIMILLPYRLVYQLVYRLVKKFGISPSFTKNNQILHSWQHCSQEILGVRPGLHLILHLLDTLELEQGG